MESVRSDRQEQLKAKRAKLEELRSQRALKATTVLSPVSPPIADVPVVEEPVLEEAPIARSDIAEGAPDKSPIIEEKSFHYDKAVQTSDDAIPIDPKELERNLRQQIELEIRHQLETEYASREPLSSKMQNLEVSQPLDQDETILESFEQSVNAALVSIDGDDTYISGSFTSNDGVIVANEALHLVFQSPSLPFTEGRSINSIDWSAHNSTLLAVAYSRQSSSRYSSSKGMVVVYDIKQGRVAFTFLASTEVLVIKFSSHNSDLLYGGGYNGQVLEWSMKGLSKLPLFQNTSRLSGHSSPVFSLLESSPDSKTTKSGKSASLITASTDGVINQWTMGLSLQQMRPLIHLNTNNAIRGHFSMYDERAPACLTCFPNDASVLLAGCEDGHIYWVNRFADSRSEAVIDPLRIFSGHQGGSITGLDSWPHHSLGGSECVFLSCGLDFSIKLHKVSNRNPPAQLETDSIEYLDSEKQMTCSSLVMDIEWRRGARKNAQFAAVTSSGEVAFWDLNKDFVDPIYTVKPSDQEAEDELVGADRSNIALSKVSWSKDGTTLAVGGLEGVIYVYRPSESLSQDEDDATEFLKRI